jgi:hypothetical protein
MSFGLSFSLILSGVDFFIMAVKQSVYAKGHGD